MKAARLTLLVLLIAGASHAANAQTPLPGRVELSGGVRLAGTLAFPAIPTVQRTPSGGERTVFVSRSRIEPSASVDLRLAVSLSNALAVEGSIAAGGATLATTIEDDIEVGVASTARESLSQYLVEGGITIGPIGWRRGRWAPFASLGGGYLRQLHEGRTLADTGRTIYAGGGTRIFLRSPRSSGIASGLRFELRGALVTGGVSVDDSRRAVPVIHASYFLRF